MSYLWSSQQLWYDRKILYSVIKYEYKQHLQTSYINWFLTKDRSWASFPVRWELSWTSYGPFWLIFVHGLNTCFRCAILYDYIRNILVKFKYEIFHRIRFQNIFFQLKYFYVEKQITSSFIQWFYYLENAILCF